MKLRGSVSITIPVTTSKYNQIQYTTEEGDEYIKKKEKKKRNPNPLCVLDTVSGVTVVKQHLYTTTWHNSPMMTAEWNIYNYKYLWLEIKIILKLIKKQNQKKKNNWYLSKDESSVED